MSLIDGKAIPRVPLDGSLDLTYRCNNACLHCWLWQPSHSSLNQEELSFEELRRIIDEARSMGCQAWGISGGEPMLRQDFKDIFDYITRKSVSYKLNTNGTLITPEIAQLLTRRGNKMVALYGATADVHDQVTRTPGSFEATMRGFAYLKEAGAGFVVQIVPMQANFHQYYQMISLAQSISPTYRVGAPWLWLSSCHSASRNRDILRQRLDPTTVIMLDVPFPVDDLRDLGEGNMSDKTDAACDAESMDDRLFDKCIAARRDFHIDPYGQISFCSFIKDPSMRFDLRQGTFRQAWDEFIPSLSGTVRGGQEYLENCGACELRSDCRWCAVYGYLEHGRYSAKVEYLCSVAAEARRFKDEWKRDHIRYFRIAEITIRLITDFEISQETFTPNIGSFQADGPGADTINLQLRSPIPRMSEIKLGKEIYRQPPWVISRQGQAWVYRSSSKVNLLSDPNVLAIFNKGHNGGVIFRSPDFYSQTALHSLTTFPTDQIFLANLLADRQGCLFHASGIILDGRGLLFVGHSEAGKSTTMKLLREYGEILCDDRIIVRRWQDGFRIHGTWSHGELPDVSPSSAPLRAVLFLEKAATNELIPITDARDKLRYALTCIIRPLITADWWEKVLDLISNLVREVPMYRMRFDKSGEIVELLRRL